MSRDGQEKSLLKSELTREDELLDQTLRPKSWAGYVGQEKLKKNIQIIMGAAQKRGEPSCEHLLFYGGPGLGKTTLALLIAKEMEVNIRVTSGPAIEKAGDLASILTNLSEGDVLFIDECLDEDTLISLADGGVKRIKEIKDGDMVVGGRVSDTFRKKVKSTIKVTTSHSILECSENHPCIVSRGGDIQIVPAEALKTTDYLLVPLSLPHITKNDLTPAQARFLAVILCDGHIDKNLITIQVEVKKDKEYFKKIFEEGLKAFGITLQTLNQEGRKRRLKRAYSITKTKRETQMLRVYSRRLVSQLLSLGIPAGKKHNIITVPKCIYYSSLKTIRSFIDTCFCCKGWIAGDNRKKGKLRPLHLSLTSPSFLHDLQFLLKKFGIFSHIRHIKKNSYRLEIIGWDSEVFKQKIGLSLERKAALFNDQSFNPKTDLVPRPKILSQFSVLDKTFLRWKYTAHLRKKPKYPHITRKYLEEIYKFIKDVSQLEPSLRHYLNYRYIPVKRIEKINKEKYVYDFTTTEHTFIANGILTHNCHRLNKIIEEYLYPAMEEFKLNLILGRGPMARTMELRLPRFTLIGATTRLALLSAPLRSRFGATFQLNFYNREDIEKIIQRSAKILKVAISPEAVKIIAQRARFTPRVANRLLKRVRDFAQMESDGKISKKIAQQALEFLEIDEQGLEAGDRKILQALIQKFEGGPVGLQALAAATSEEEDTILDIYEPYLMQLGFIERTPRGRVATKLAFQHLGKKYRGPQRFLL